MKILAIEKELSSIDDSVFEPLLKLEASIVWRLYQSGVLREIYFRDDQTTAVLVLECANVEEAHTILDALPLVNAGLIAFDVIPLKPYPGYARLFAQDGVNP